MLVAPVQARAPGATKGQFSGNRHLAVEAASFYWHFVDVVWIGLFTTIYVIG